jgi:transposase InsO family protein
VSRKGNPYDNALAESFVATRKIECFGDALPPSRGGMGTVHPAHDAPLLRHSR